MGSITYGAGLEQDAKLATDAAEGHKALSLADIRAKLTDSAMKARNQQPPQGGFFTPSEGQDQWQQPSI